ncbi:class I adenylate-forming enzyme family protein [Microbispora sp. CA-102843]|uniref:class I adenylate-forming enzyme family protein n=1 Tax=Microbispora sp. CA-102843 TaxID=3239952 RepID=UPI003D8F3D3E
MLVGDIVRRNATFFGSHGAVVVPGERHISWRELDERTDRFANALHGLGLVKGDRLAILAPNCAEYLDFFFGCAKSGVIGAATNIRLAGHEIVSYLSYVQPVAILVHADLADFARSWLDDLPSLREVIGIGEGHGFGRDLEELIAGAAPGEPDVAITESDVYQLGATSGTTGIPKAAMLSHRNAIAAMVSWLAEIPVRERETALQCIPYFFNPGGAAGLHPVLMKGGRLVIPKAFAPRAFLEAIPRYCVTHTVLVPTMLQMVLNEPDVASYDMSSLRAINTGGSPFPGPLLARGRQSMGDVFYPIYGMAESYSCATILRPQNQFSEGTPQQVAQLSSVGKPMVLTNVRVVQPEQDRWGERDVPHDGGTAGEIWLASDTVSAGYFRMPEETAAGRNGRWFATGDMAVIDAEGFVMIVDRLKDMIITGGINVFSIEVERALLQHPDVEQAAVIGVPHPTWGEAIHAVVRTRPGGDVPEAELLEFAAARLAHYKKPRSVSFVGEFPVSGNGKILKRLLREQWEAGRRP